MQSLPSCIHRVIAKVANLWDYGRARLPVLFHHAGEFIVSDLEADWPYGVRPEFVAAFSKSRTYSAEQPSDGGI